MKKGLKKEGEKWINSCDEGTDPWVPISIDSCPITVKAKQDSTTEGKSWFLDFEFATFGQERNCSLW